MPDEESEIVFGPGITVSLNGESVRFTDKCEGRMLTIESELGDFVITFDQTDQKATADALEAVEAYVKRMLPPRQTRVLQ